MSLSGRPSENFVTKVEKKGHLCTVDIYLLMSLQLIQFNFLKKLYKHDSSLVMWPLFKILKIIPKIQFPHLKIGNLAVLYYYCCIACDQILFLFFVCLEEKVELLCSLDRRCRAKLYCSSLLIKH